MACPGPAGRSGGTCAVSARTACRAWRPPPRPRWPDQHPNTDAPEGDRARQAPEVRASGAFCVGLAVRNAKRCGFAGVAADQAIRLPPRGQSAGFCVRHEKILQPVSVEPATTALPAQGATERALP
jgi:hypothetical protein